VHQHFMLVENMTVLDNVMLGGEGGFRLNAHRKKVEPNCVRFVSVTRWMWIRSTKFKTFRSAYSARWKF
jgi:ABC-type sugar transport system ATPase subunit